MCALMFEPVGLNGLAHCYMIMQINHILYCVNTCTSEYLKLN